MSYADIRASSRAAHSKKYANGGRTSRKPGVVINVISQSPAGPTGPSGQLPTPIGANGPAMPPPPPPAPPKPIQPATANQAMGAMGGPQGMFAKGGRVKCMATGGKAGAASGVARLKKQKNPTAQF